MDLLEFERLWPRRHELDPQLREELERQVEKCRHSRAYARGGYEVRRMCSRIEELRAPGDFAYRMRIYAQNHPEEAKSWSGNGWLKWPVLTTGVAAGAVAMMLAFGPLEETRDGAAVQRLADDETPVREPAVKAMDEVRGPVRQEALATQQGDSLNTGDTLKAMRDATGVPVWDVRSVSTNE